MERKGLLGTLTLVGAALSKTDLIPVQKCFAFRGNFVIATNDQIALVAPCGHDKDMVLHGQTLLGLLRNTHTEQIDFSVTNNEVTLSTGKSTFNLPSQPIEDFQFVEPDGPWDVQTPITEDFITGLELCLITASSDNAQPALQGVSLNGGKEAHLYASDGDAISDYGLGPIKGLKGTYMMHSAFCEALLGLIADTDSFDGSIMFNKEWACANMTSGYLLYGRLIENDNPLDFKGQIEKTIKTSPTMIDAPVGLDHALSRARVVADAETAKTVASVTKGKLHLKTEASYGVVEDTLTFKHEDVGADLSAALMQRSLKNATQLAIAEGYCIFTSDKLTVVTGNL